MAWSFPVRAFIVSSILFMGLTLLMFPPDVECQGAESPICTRGSTASTEEVEPALDSRPDTERTTAGAWGTAVMVAVAAGTEPSSSPFFPYALAASILMLLATVIEGERSRRRRPLGFLGVGQSHALPRTAWCRVALGGLPDGKGISGVTSSRRWSR